MTKKKNYFLTSNEIFSLGLSPGEFAVYSYLRLCENRRTHQCWPSYKTIGAATNMSVNTVRKHSSIKTERPSAENKWPQRFAKRSGDPRG